MAGSMDGAPSAYTEAGPPERMIPAGWRAATSSAEMVLGTISLWTWASRTRRAISWAYCAPKSTTRTVAKSVAMGTPRRPGGGIGGWGAGYWPGAGGRSAGVWRRRSSPTPNAPG